MAKINSSNSGRKPSIYFEFELPVKPHVKKYLEKHYGNPVCMDRNTPEGKYIFQLIEDERKEDDNKHRVYPCSVIIQIRERIFIRQGSFLTKTNITRFNNFVDDMLKERFRTYCSALVDEAGLKMADAFRKFSDKFGFDETDWSFDALKKDFYRNKNKLKPDNQ